MQSCRLTKRHSNLAIAGLMLLLRAQVLGAQLREERPEADLVDCDS
jgi:hypothetical protein